MVHNPGEQPLLFLEANGKWYLEKSPPYLPLGQGLYDYLGYDQNQQSEEELLRLRELLRCILCGYNSRSSEELRCNWESNSAQRQWTAEDVRREVGELYRNVRDHLEEDGFLERISEGVVNQNRTRYRIMIPGHRDHQERTWAGVDDVIYLLDLIGYRHQPYHLIHQIIDCRNDLENRLNEFIPSSGDSNLSVVRERLSSIHHIWGRESRAADSIQCIEIYGTLSLLSPLLVIPADFSSRLQSAYRREVFSTLLELNDGDRRRILGENLDNNLSFLSGQIAWRLRTENWLCLGLFQGVCRNSIPVFVKKGYFEEKVKNKFSGVNQNSINAKVHGRLISFEPSYYSELTTLFRQILSTPQDSEDSVSEEDIQQKSRFHALVVDGENGTKIINPSEPTYVDGDLLCFFNQHYGDSHGYLSLLCKTGINIADDGWVNRMIGELQRNRDALRDRIETEGGTLEEQYSPEEYEVEW